MSAENNRNQQRPRHYLETGSYDDPHEAWLELSRPLVLSDIEVKVETADSEVLHDPGVYL